jgi:hypothetical protein
MVGTSRGDVSGGSAAGKLRPLGARTSQRDALTSTPKSRHCHAEFPFRLAASQIFAFLVPFGGERMLIK